MIFVPFTLSESFTQSPSHKLIQLLLGPHFKLLYDLIIFHNIFGLITENDIFFEL